MTVITGGVPCGGTPVPPVDSRTVPLGLQRCGGPSLRGNIGGLHLRLGDDLDPDGFQLTIDGLDYLGLPRPAPWNVISPPPPQACGSCGVAERGCSIGPGPSVEVGGVGGRGTAHTSGFSGDLSRTGVRVSLSTIELDPDPDGYLLTMTTMSTLLGLRVLRDCTGVELPDDYIALAALRHHGPLHRLSRDVASGGCAARKRDIVGLRHRLSSTTVLLRIDGPGARVTVNTIGVDLDGDWLLVGAGGHGSELRGIPSNGTSTLQLDSGDYVLGLTGVSEQNCAINGPGGHTATITATPWRVSASRGDMHCQNDPGGRHR